ncbi:MAG: ATP-binding protein [Leptonema sp. (in: Bacteria)]|nr:ATP-binding protein [Leptonema sp. (in: bacteria)]
MLNGALTDALLKLGKSGLYGTVGDFTRWLSYSFQINANEDEVKTSLDLLLSNGQFVREADFQDDYISDTIELFPDAYSFTCPRQLQSSPIQFFRSRLLSFLKQKNRVTEEEKIDIVIAAVEAIENAVKYSASGEVVVRFEMQSDQFRVEIENDVATAQPDHDIEIGKYDSSRTLMRGMMVMGRLFDEMDIVIDEHNRATFMAAKKLSINH